MAMSLVARARLRDAPSVETARKIAGDTELRGIAGAGTGFLIDPFNQRWHAATCPRLPGMTTGEPKWFAATVAAREAFLGQRLARYPTAKPILACATCGRSPRSTAAAARAVATGQRPRSPFIWRTGGGFEAWADEYVRNESAADSAAWHLRRLITGELRGLPGPAGRVLHAAYGGQRWRGTDVENLLFNNIDQTSGVFRAPGGLGLRFEDLGLIVPLAPDGTRWPCFYRYRLAQPGDPFAAARQGQLICRVPEAIVPDGPARLAARIWLAVRRARPRPGTGAPREDGGFLLRIAVHQLQPALSIKAVVDGATAAMQRDDPGRIREAINRLARLLATDADHLLMLATETSAPLGTRSRSSPASKESLFMLDGADQVRVTPDDDRCIAAEVITAGGDGPARLTVEVYSAERA